MNDNELIAALAGGDDRALRELFTRHAPWLAARLRGVLPASEVEDVLQETFLAVWRGAKRYRPEPGASAGVYPPRCPYRMPPSYATNRPPSLPRPPPVQLGLAP